MYFFDRTINKQIIRQKIKKIQLKAIFDKILGNFVLHATIFSGVARVTKLVGQIADFFNLQGKTCKK